MMYTQNASLTMVFCLQGTEDEHLISSDKKKGFPDNKSLGSSASIRTSIFQGDGTEMDNGEEEGKRNLGFISKVYGFMCEPSRRSQNRTTLL